MTANPDDRQTGFLETGGAWAGYLVLGIGVVIVAFGFLIGAVAAWQSWRASGAISA